MFLSVHVVDQLNFFGNVKTGAALKVATLMSGSGRMKHVGWAAMPNNSIQ